MSWLVAVVKLHVKMEDTEKQWTQLCSLPRQGQLAREFAAKTSAADTCTLYMSISPPVATRGGVEICSQLGTGHPVPQLQLEVMAEEDLQLVPTVP